MDWRAMARLGALVAMLAGCGGSGPTPAPLPLPLRGARVISLSSSHACAALMDGTAHCWGENAFGQLGTGASSAPVATPVTVPGLNGLGDIVAGFNYTCGAVADGAVACWGNDTLGQIGTSVAAADGGADVPAMDIEVLGPTGVMGLGPVVDALATAGASEGLGSYTCAHQTDGTVQCWGANALGIDGTSAQSIVPTELVGLTAVHTMAAGGVMACFSLNDGTARCLGRGSLGSQIAATSSSAIEVTGLFGVVTVAAGSFHACALMKDGTVQCWGAWRGDANASTLAAQVDGVAGAVNIAAGGNETCALLGDGSVTCWSTIGTDPPALVKGLRPATAISVGNGTFCAIVTDGEIQCWGLRDNGILGNGVLPTGLEPTDLVTTPVTVVAGS
jgi:alpha-tubulin suppressor-like RCC1 family protein